MRLIIPDHLTMAAARRALGYNLADIEFIGQGHMSDFEKGKKDLSHKNWARLVRFYEGEGITFTNNGFVFEMTGETFFKIEEEKRDG